MRSFGSAADGQQPQWRSSPRKPHRIKSSRSRLAVVVRLDDVPVLMLGNLLGDPAQPEGSGAADKLMDGARPFGGGDHQLGIGRRLLAELHGLEVHGLVLPLFRSCSAAPT